MLNLDKTRTLETVTLALILTLSSLTALCIEPVNAQSADSTSKELVQVTNERLTVSHIWGNRVVMQLEKGDRVEGKYIVSKIFYYPNWPTIDLKAEVVVKDPNDTSIYYAYTKKGGSFNFTASYLGNYTILFVSNLVGELLWGGYYLTTSAINQATPLEVTLNYTITGSPLEIGISSPINQTYLQNNLSLDFSSSRVYDWAGYSLDGAALVPICDSNGSVPMNNSVSSVDNVSTHKNFGNATLRNLSKDAHTLTLYANDTYGNMASQTVAFTVGSSTLAPSLLTLLLVVALSVVLGVLAVILLYRRHRKQNLPITS